VEELDFQGLLDRFGKDGYTRGEQIILANYGTNQTLLTLIFGTPCEVTVIKQKDRGDDYIRLVHIIGDGEILCHASTVIPKARNRPDVLEDILAKKLGLGQIVVTHDIPNHRKLLNIGHDRTAFWRTYALEGPDLYLEITEKFPMAPFEREGFIRRDKAW